MNRICPHCEQSIENPPYGNHFNCPLCGTSIYFSHCWRCGKPINGSPDNKCDKCNWHHCADCTACSPDCGQTERQRRVIGTITYREEIAELFTCDAEDPDNYADDEMTLQDLEDETPDACWEDWLGEDPAAYSDDSDRR